MNTPRLRPTDRRRNRTTWMCSALWTIVQFMNNLTHIAQLSSVYRWDSMDSSEDENKALLYFFVQLFLAEFSFLIFLIHYPHHIQRELNQKNNKKQRIWKFITQSWASPYPQSRECSWVWCRDALLSSRRALWGLSLKRECNYISAFRYLLTIY